VVEVGLSGAFPRSEELVEGTRASDRGRASQSELEQLFLREAKVIAALQEQSGLDSVVDGQLNWQDLFRPFSELFTGIQLGSLTRWFDNNTFYRKPIITEKIALRGPKIVRYFRHDLLPQGSLKKAILPGPFTFAVMSQDNVYHSFPELVDSIAHALKDTVSELREAGYACFQFNEPSLVFRKASKDELRVARNAFETCAKSAGAKTVLQTYFGDAGQIITQLLDFPVDRIGIDLYQTLTESIAEFNFDRELGCGCVDGRNSLLESSADLKRLVARVKQEVNPKEISLNPNCDLDFLPYSVAIKKVRLLSETKKIMV
jgi:5-methyltetrahydropteroyltriglutamate--homocysteine methyltransferase